MPTPSINRLAALAHQATGHPIRWHLDGPKGEWDGTRISIRHGMSLAQTRCTLAHEIAHAQHHDPCGTNPRAEHRADRRAAHLLITPMAYAQAEETFDGDINRIAEELTVTVHLVTVWRDTYERTPVICPQCSSENVTIQLVQTGGKNAHKGTGAIGHTNNAARGMTAMMTLGMSNLVWKKSKGTTRQKFTNVKQAVCQSCGNSWTVK